MVERSQVAWRCPCSPVVPVTFKESKRQATLAPPNTCSLLFPNSRAHGLPAGLLATQNKNYISQLPFGKDSHMTKFWPMGWL